MQDSNYTYTRLGAGFEMIGPTGDGLFLNLGLMESRPICPFEGSIRTKSHAVAISREEFMDAYFQVVNYQMGLVEEKEFEPTTLAAVEKINAACHEYSTESGWALL